MAATSDSPIRAPGIRQRPRESGVKANAGSGAADAINGALAAEQRHQAASSGSSTWWPWQPVHHQVGC